MNHFRTILDRGHTGTPFESREAAEKVAASNAADDPHSEYRVEFLGNAYRVRVYEDGELMVAL